MSQILLPPLSHYLNDDHATTSSTKGLTRSATLTSQRIQNTAEPPTTSSSPLLQRSFSVSASDLSKPLPLAAAAQGGHWDDATPWEMYFDPNYTFFGGTILDPRYRKRQQEVLKAMALHDHHLHLHPPPSSGPSIAADQLQQPSLPYSVMDAVHHQLYHHPLMATIDPQPPSSSSVMPIDEKGKRTSSLSPTSVQTMYYPAESSPTGTHLKPEEHQARLALLQAIRSDSYQSPTTTTTTNTLKRKKNKQNTSSKPSGATTTKTTIVPPYPHRDSSRYFWMETPTPTQEEKPHSSSTFDLTSFQEAGHVSSHQPTTTTTHHYHRSSHTNADRRYRTSFLYFLFGFLFPPVWVIGALYTPSEYHQSSHGHRIDLMWKRSCRMAFALFTFGLLVMVVIILALNPGALGWRTSRTDLNSAQQFIPVVVAQ